MYNVPAKYFFRLHHVRPRFKNEVESVLGYVAFCIAQIGKANTDVFKAQLCKGIRQYGINASKTQKTIDNWRTEIGAIFGMYIECPNGTTVPTQQTIDLANTSDLQAFSLGSFIHFNIREVILRPSPLTKCLMQESPSILINGCSGLFLQLISTQLTDVSFVIAC